MTELTFRKAGLEDAAGLSTVLQEIAAAGKRQKPSDMAHVRAHYLAHEDQLFTLLAERDGSVLGFQSVKRGVDGNPYGAPVGWGVIGTHIRPSAARMGIGRSLFCRTKNLAKKLGLPAIDATISTSNPEGLAYYSAMGFTDYRWHDGAVSKRFDLT